MTAVGQYEFPLLHKTLHSGFFVFLRRKSDITDRRALELLGLADHERADIPASDAKVPAGAVFITECADWIHVADDLLYTQWHRTGADLAECVQATDVFTVVLGDVDESYAFSYYEAGRLVRRLVVESPGYSDRIVTQDIGTAFSVEDDALRTRDAREIGLTVARHLGIDPRHSLETIRCYVPPAPSR